MGDSHYLENGQPELLFTCDTMIVSEWEPADNE